MYMMHKFVHLTCHVPAVLQPRTHTCIPTHQALQRAAINK